MREIVAIIDTFPFFFPFLPRIIHESALEIGMEKCEAKFHGCVALRPSLRGFRKGVNNEFSLWEKTSRNSMLATTMSAPRLAKYNSQF